jgi:hypothetical protein
MKDTTCTVQLTNHDAFWVVFLFSCDQKIEGLATTVCPNSGLNVWALILSSAQRFRGAARVMIGTAERKAWWLGGLQAAIRYTY